MLTNIDVYKTAKDHCNKLINNSESFDSYMENLYNNYDNYINQTNYKKYIIENFNNINDENIDKELLINYVQNNPVGMYIHLLNMVQCIKDIYCSNNELTESNILNYNKVKSKFKERINFITIDYSTKCRSGYFNKREVN